MSDDKNVFGGGNPRGLYVPLTEIEQEYLSRLIEADDLEVVIHGWAILPQPKIIFGDLRVSIVFRLTFDGLSAPQKLYYLDLELRTQAGMPLYREKQSTIYDGKPIEIATGVELDFAWDIALHHIDPKVIKALMPKTIGLTSRRLDKDTGEASLTGNMQLDTSKKRILHQLAENERQLREDDAAKVAQVIKEAESR